MFLITSGTHIFGYGSLILHLLVLILKGKNTSSLLIIFIFSDLTLHSWLFIETHLSGVAPRIIPLNNDIAATLFKEIQTFLYHVILFH